MTQYLRNVWYAAAWEEEIADGGLLSRTFLGEPAVIFRKTDGSYSMLNDRCPHRFAPLSSGHHKGDRVACPYHGLEFNSEGQCVHNPFGAQSPKNAKVQAYPIEARHGLIWFWAGAPELANPDLIPDYSFLPEQDLYRRRTHIDCNYQLLVDNLMDLSHVEFIHNETFKPTGAFFNGRHDVKEGENGEIWSNNYLPDVGSPDYLPGAPAGANLDNWLEMRWNAPSLLMLRLSFTLAGDPIDKPVVPVMWTPHIITPESETSTHYLWTCHPTAESEAMARKVFDDEDKPMLEAIQARMAGADFWTLKPVILQVDTGAVYTRRRLQKLIMEEQGLPLSKSA